MASSLDVADNHTVKVSHVYIDGACLHSHHQDLHFNISPSLSNY
jgi:hypothetical protein